MSPAPFMRFLYRHRKLYQPSESCCSTMVQPSARSLAETSSARSSMMPEHRNRPPSFRKGRTLPERPMMTSATMLATTMS